MTATTDERHIPLAGTFNLRDVGGYAAAAGVRVRWRTLFRADSLHRLPAEAQEALLARGVRTVIDLRHAGELAVAPHILADAPGVAYHHRSLFGEGRELGPTGGDLGALYRAVLDRRGAEIAAVFGLLAAPDALPAVVHCTAGKDRTGLIVALLLGVAGVPAATIAEDYALTAQYLVAEFWAEARVRAEASGHDWEAYQQLLICPPELMLATLAYLDERYGGVVPYLLAQGVTAEQIATLRAALLDTGATDEEGAR